MTFIEGIGDEVTAFFVIVIVVVLATLVTFIGSGPHLYSPVHTRAVHIAVLSSREPPQTLTTVQPPNPPNASNPVESSTSPQYESPTPNWPTSNNVHRDAPQANTEDDTEEEQSSSDETTRPPENDAPESETTPTAPEEDTARNGEGIRVRLKYLDDTERTVRSSPLTKVLDFKRNHFPEDLANNRVVRLIFCGHLLRDTSTLESYRVVDNSVVHVQVLAAQAQQTRSSLAQQPELDLSHFLWPLVSVILGMCWVFYFKYPEFFSVISLSLLFVFTASFFVFYTHVHQ